MSPDAGLGTASPRISTRVLLVATLVLAVLLVAAVVVGYAVLHQPRLEPVPLPSVSAIP